MKNIFVIFGLLIVLASVWVANDSGNQALAVSGCCKIRASQNDPWKQFGTDLESCKEKNNTEDKVNDNDSDNVFTKNGNVWWNTAC